MDSHRVHASPIITGLPSSERPPRLESADEPLAREQVKPKPTRPAAFPKSKIKILLLDGVHQNAVDMFLKEGYQVETHLKISEADLIAKARDVHAIGVRSRSQINQRVLDAAERLLAVGCFCIGTDQTDLMAAEKQGVSVFNAPFSNTRSVAEMIIAEIICLARQLCDRSMELHRGKWNKLSKNCWELRGKVLGLVGYGHVGSQVSVLAESMGMQVIYYDTVSKLPLGNANPVDSLEDLLKRSDFVSLHVPLTPQTENMMGSAEIAQMKQGAYLLNASRGTVVDIPALASALRSGHLGGAAVDVFPSEPANNADGWISELQGCPNTILTPHIGGSTEEAQGKIGVEVAAKIIKLINSGCTLGAVNFPNVDLPSKPNTHRVLNIHRNVPGVLRDINNILSQYNIVGQVLSTTEHVGYMIAEVESEVPEVSADVYSTLSGLPSNIRTRILY